MTLRNFSNDSTQYIHLMPPVDPVFDCQSVFYFDVSHKELKIYDLAEKVWRSVDVPEELPDYG